MKMFMKQSSLLSIYLFIFLVLQNAISHSESATRSDARDAVHKLIILGSGPAGLTAALFAARAQLKPLVLAGKRPGGHLISTTYVNNWPGEESIFGADLIEKIRIHAENSGAIMIDETAVTIDLQENPFVITTDNGTVLKTNSLIIATGSVPRRLSCKNEDRYWGRGVSACVICDGPLYRNKEVIVVGGGDSAMEYATVLAKFAKSVTIIQNLSYLTASAPMQQRALNNPIIKKIYYSSSISEIVGDEEGITGAIVRNLETNETIILKADGIFLAIGHLPDTAVCKGELDLDRFGFVQIHDYVKTSLEGVYAAGDVACPLYKQAICAAGTGCMAALAAERYLLETKAHRLPCQLQ